MERYRVGSFGEPEAEVARLMQQASAFSGKERNAMAACGMPVSGRGLDVGCGPGHFGAMLMEAWDTELEIDGADVDKISLDQAATRLRRIREVDCSGEGALIGAAETQYDFAYSRLFLRHLVNPRVALMRQVDAVKPGGWVGAIDVSDRSLLMDPEGEPIKALRQLRRQWFFDRRCSGDIGHRLPGLFSRAGLVEIRVRPVVVDTATIGAPAFAQIVLVPFLQAAAEAEGSHLSGKVKSAEKFIAYWRQKPDAYAAITLFVVGGRKPA